MRLVLVCSLLGNQLLCEFATVNIDWYFSLPRFSQSLSACILRSGAIGNCPSDPQTHTQSCAPAASSHRYLPMHCVGSGGLLFKMQAIRSLSVSVSEQQATSSWVIGMILLAQQKLFLLLTRLPSVFLSSWFSWSTPSHVTNLKRGWVKGIGLLLLSGRSGKLYVLSKLHLSPPIHCSLCSDRWVY